MSDKKKNRLKLKAKIPVVENQHGQKYVEQHEKLNSININFIDEGIDRTYKKLSANEENNSSDDDIFMDTDEEDDDIIIMKEKISEEHKENDKKVIDKSLIDLRKILINFSFPACFVWQLQDLPVYQTSVQNVATTKTREIDLLETPPLPRFRRNYLCRKKNYGITSICDNTDNHLPVCNQSQPEVCDIERTNVKRKFMDSVENNYKRLELSGNKTSTEGGTDNDSRFQLKHEKIKPRTCPFCVMPFQERMTAVEIDTHIAACLSMDEDDVTW